MQQLCASIANTNKAHLDLIFPDLESESGMLLSAWLLIATLAAANEELEKIFYEEKFVFS